MVCLGVKVGPCCVPCSLLDYVSLKTDTEEEAQCMPFKQNIGSKRKKGSLLLPLDGPQHVGEANRLSSATKGQEGARSQLTSTTFTPLGVSAPRWAVTV